jgi:hypothetical protein
LIGRIGGHWRALIAGAAGATFGLGLSRALAETLSLSLSWLASWPGALVSAAACVLVAAASWNQLARNPAVEAPITAFLSLFLPLLYLMQRSVNLLAAYGTLVAGLLLTVVLLAQTHRAGRLFPPAALLITTFGIYLLTLGRSVGQADTFEFQVVAHNLGIAHPTGYPLYILLGKLFTLLPIGTVATRVNLLSAVCAAAAILVLYACLRALQETAASPHRWADAASRTLALLGALSFGVSPTLWSQAVEAEVYALNILLVVVILWLLLYALQPAGQHRQLWVPALAGTLGLGLSHHLTIVLVLPSIALTLLLVRPRLPAKRWLAAASFFSGGLLIYLYLPLRWPALHEGAWMSLREFLNWVLGSRFKGALVLSAWRTDPLRYEIVARLILGQWGWAGVALAGTGILALIRQSWHTALVTLALWIPYAFYALSYYVPDLSVFMIPAHLVMALWIGLGAWATARLVGRRLNREGAALSLAVVLLALLPLSLVIRHGPAIDRSRPNPLEDWGRHVLGLALDDGAAILADSEKVAPLYYLQQTEAIRPDLEIIVLPTEELYRSEVDRRLAAGQAVYLARFVPRLEGICHLRSVPQAGGQLIEVSRDPLTSVPALEESLDIRLGPAIRLIGLEPALDGWLTAYPDPFRITLYWTADSPVGGIYQVWLRLVDKRGQPQWRSGGVHPAGNDYPTSAWQPGEIVPDSHDFIVPAGLPPGDYELQVALLAPFETASLLPAGSADPWLTLGRLRVEPPLAAPQPARPVRIWLCNSVITGLMVDQAVRPGADLPVELLARFGGERPTVTLGWDGQVGQSLSLIEPVTGMTLTAPDTAGNYVLIMQHARPLRCGWLQGLATSCPLGTITVSSAPLPPGAVNFADLIALLEVELPDPVLRPGGTLDVTLIWKALGPIGDNYTAFLHILDEADQIVGQVDAWPIQGTYATSQWTPGETVRDPYRIPVAPDAAPGRYRLEIGWYLLGTMRRLNVVDSAGMAIDDRVLLENLLLP